MFENSVKQKLSRGEVVWGSAPVLPHPLAIQLTIDSGADFLWIDTEHASFGMEALELTPAIIRSKGVMPMIRVSHLDQGLIKKALDVGAMAVMLPQIDNAAQAALAVKYAKYPPLGTRGVSPMWTFYNGVDWKDYLPAANDEIMVVAQVESLEALHQVEAIAATPGVDVVFAGPADLAASLGHIGDTAHPDVQKFLAEFPARVAKQGKAAGISVGGVEASYQAFRQGYRFINYGNLLWDGANALKANLLHLRERCKNA